MNTNLKTERLINMTGLAILVEYTLTTIHHVYGGLVYGTASRLLTPITFGIPLLITLALLSLYKRTRNGVALTLLSIVIGLFWVMVLGLMEGGYNHAVKDILFFASVPVATVQQFYPPTIFNDFVYPPNNVFFETTGVLTLVAASFPALLMYRLLRARYRNQQSLVQEPVAPVAMTVLGSLGVAASVVGLSLLYAYMLTNRSVLLLPTLLVTGLSALTIAVARGVRPRRK